MNAATNEVDVEYEETEMNTAEKSLRGLVDKWLAPTPATPVHVTRFGRTRADNLRFVCVQVARPTCSLAIFFFRHDDGSWCVFPPYGERPAIAYPRAA